LVWLPARLRQRAREGNPFQLEVGIWDGAGGVIAVLAFWHHGGFWLATVTSNAIFWSGAGAVHLRELVGEGNVRADNLLPAIVNLAVAATLVTFYILAT
jgi:hypothetical protein